MRKFLTFFAMMFALVGGALPAHAWESSEIDQMTLVTHSNCEYKKATFSQSNPTILIRTTSSASSNSQPEITIYQKNDYGHQYIVAYDGNAWEVNVGKNKMKSDVWHESKDQNYTPPTDDGYKVKIKDAKASTTYALTVSVEGGEPYLNVRENTPYILIDSSSTPFNYEDGNWVYTVNASSADKQFRILNQSNTDNFETDIEGKFLGTSDTGWEINSSGTRTLKLHGHSYNNKYTAKSGGIYKLSFPGSANLLEYNKDFTLTITKSDPDPEEITLDGNSAPQIAGWFFGQDEWSFDPTDKPKQLFTKTSEDPWTYVYNFTAGDDNGNVYFDLRVNGKIYKPANISLNGSTTTFTEVTDANYNNGNNHETYQSHGSFI